MSQLNPEIQLLKQKLIEMQRLVRMQLNKCYSALIDYDINIAKEVIFNEKRVNALELKIDWDCENMLALYSPVAVDLRFILAALKINNNLERIGDYAKGIAHYVIDVQTPFPKEILLDYKFAEMFSVTSAMINDSIVAFVNEDTTLARSIFAQDEVLDKFNKDATETTLKYIEEKRPDGLHYLNSLSIIRKLERVGDQTKNIVEEIIFYIEAKVLKHPDKREEL